MCAHTREDVFVPYSYHRVEELVLNVGCDLGVQAPWIGALALH